MVVNFNIAYILTNIDNILTNISFTLMNKSCNYAFLCGVAMFSLWFNDFSCPLSGSDVCVVA